MFIWNDYGYYTNEWLWLIRTQASTSGAIETLIVVIWLLSVSSRGMPNLAHNEKLWSLKNKVIMLYGIYSIKNYHYSIINSIIYYGWNYLNWLVVFLYSWGENCESSHWWETREECHRRRSYGILVKARPLSCEHYGLWLYNLLMSLLSTNELNESL